MEQDPPYIGNKSSIYCGPTLLGLFGVPPGHYLTKCSLLCEAVTGGVSTTASTSYFYVKGLQLEDMPVLSPLLFPHPRTPVFYAVLCSSIIGKALLGWVEGRPGAEVRGLVFLVLFFSPQSSYLLFPFLAYYNG